MERSNEGTARMIAESIEEVLDFEGQLGKKIWCLPFIRVKVLLDSSKLLPTGYPLKRNASDTLWIKYKIERIAGFCYLCGMLGHMQFLCKEQESQDNADAYGP